MYRRPENLTGAGLIVKFETGMSWRQFSNFSFRITLFVLMRPPLLFTNHTLGIHYYKADWKYSGMCDVMFSSCILLPQNGSNGIFTKITFPGCSVPCVVTFSASVSHFLFASQGKRTLPGWASPKVTWGRTRWCSTSSTTPWGSTRPWKASDWWGARITPPVETHNLTVSL